MKRLLNRGAAAPLGAAVLLAALAWAAPGAVSAAESAAAATPVQVVETFQSALISVMKDGKKLGFQGRFGQLAPVVADSHDLRTIAKFAAGRYWDTLTDPQKEALLETFAKQSIATYAYRFDSYNGETFSTESAQKLPNGDTLVHTLFTQSSGEPMHFDYDLRRGGDGWKIINIIVDGVSDLAVKRAEYTSILGNGGVDALIAKMNAQIAQYAGRDAANETPNAAAA